MIRQIAAFWCHSIIGMSLFFPLCGDSALIETLPKLPPSSSYHYQLFDLGPCNLSPEKLTRQSLPLSYGARINDFGQVIFNDERQGYIRDIAGGEAAPQLFGMSAHCYAINNNGKLLVSLERTPSSWRWLLWQQNELSHTDHRFIELNGVEGKNLFFHSLNDQGVAVGVFNAQGPLKPIIFSPEDGLHNLGYYLGYDLCGSALAVNCKTTVAGLLDENDKSTPYAWNKKWGLHKLTSFKWRWEAMMRRDIEGSVQFSDIALDDNGFIYATFWEKNDEQHAPPSSHYHAFWWDPQSDELRALDLGGMRISAVAAEGATLVGSLRGNAAICDIGSKPLYLRELLVDNLDSWELLEATDINLQGDMVGFGEHNGVLHNFLLQRQNR